MELVSSFDSPQDAEKSLMHMLEAKRVIMGFGHRVYRAEDPRARHLRDRSKVLGEKSGHPEWFQILQHLEEETMKPYVSKGICVNVDFFAGSIYYLLDIPDDLFISIFALGRIPGWTLQCVEQYQDNILLRPLTEYIGEMDLEYTSIEDRS